MRNVLNVKSEATSFQIADTEWEERLFFGRWEGALFAIGLSTLAKS